jgi:hypothetical protein
MSKEAITMTTAIDDLRRMSRTLKGIFGWVFGVGCFLLFSEVAYMPLKGLILTWGDPDADVALQAAAEACLTALPAVLLLAALWTARSLFKAFEAGEVLAADSSKRLGRLGEWLIASALAAIIFGPDPGQHNPAFGGYLSAHVVLGCIGLAIRLFGRVLGLAADINADHAQIV